MVVSACGMGDFLSYSKVRRDKNTAKGWRHFSHALSAIKFALIRQFFECQS